MKLKMFKKIVMSFTIVATITSCSTTQYQVFEVKAPELQQKENALVFENEDVKISYNLWSENGKVCFFVENKTDRNIFVDRKQTFLIINGKAEEYYKNREYTQTVSVGYSAADAVAVKGAWSNMGDIYDVVAVAKNKTAKVATKSVTTKENVHECIPAKSYKVFMEYSINPKTHITCDKSIDIPSVSAVVGSFNEANSPMNITSRIAYSFDTEGKNIKSVDNKFWISKITNYSHQGATEKKKERVNCSTIEKNTEYFKVAGPDKFYKIIVDIKKKYMSYQSYL